jgi:hypothetical protein
MLRIAMSPSRQLASATGPASRLVMPPLCQGFVKVGVTVCD